MARTPRDSKIESREARRRLAVRHDPYWRQVVPGTFLGYRRKGGDVAGSWVKRTLVGTAYRKTVFAAADDYAEADGEKILSYAQAILFSTKPDSPTKRSSRLTVADAMEDYISARAAERSEASARDSRLTIDRHIVPKLGARPLADLTRDELEEWRNGLVTGEKKIRGKAQKIDLNDPEVLRKRRSTANRIMTTLKAALNRAAQRDPNLNDAAWRHLKPFTGADAARVRFLMEPEVARLLGACEPDFRDLVHAAALTGAPYSVLAAIRACDFDMHAGSVLLAEPGKHLKRGVPLTPEGIALFERLSKGKPRDALLFKPEGHDRWGKGMQHRRMRAACKAARIEPPISFHILRHTLATLLLRRGASMPIIAKVLGHSTSRMTERHYAHLADEFWKQEAMAAMPTFAAPPEGASEPASKAPPKGATKAPSEAPSPGKPTVTSGKVKGQKTTRVKGG